MRISYPEAERMGWNYEDVYLFAFSELDYLTTELQKLYNNDGINDIPSYVLRLVKKMLETWESIFLIYSHNRDYVSACTLCRNIIDNLATIYHVKMKRCSNIIYMFWMEFFVDIRIIQIIIK